VNENARPPTGRATTLRQNQNKELKMTSNDAGGNASSARTPMGADVPSKPPISPAARKFAEYLARRMQPMIDKAQRERSAISNTYPTSNQDDQ
jgi:hypothetical protein